jgi:hypothetical protein
VTPQPPKSIHRELPSPRPKAIGRIERRMKNERMRSLRVKSHLFPVLRAKVKPMIAAASIRR